jgi:ferric-dicitrate binding protein FerR (iron transport regulator)
MRTILYVDDHVVTGEDSSAVISFKDLSTLLLKGDSEVVLAAPPDRALEIDLKKGDLWINLKKVLSGEPVEVKSNLGTVGIRGTTFVFHVDETQSTVKVIEGVVNFKSTATGESVEVSAGQKVSATSQGLSEVQSFDVEEEQAEWDELQEEPLCCCMPALPMMLSLLAAAITKIL